MTVDVSGAGSSGEPLDTAAIRARHYEHTITQQGDPFSNCMGCTRSYGGYHEWPCALARAADEIDALRAENARLNELKQRVGKPTLALVDRMQAAEAKLAAVEAERDQLLAQIRLAHRQRCETGEPCECCDFILAELALPAGSGAALTGDDQAAEVCCPWLPVLGIHAFACEAPMCNADSPQSRNVGCQRDPGHDGNHLGLLTVEWAAGSGRPASGATPAEVEQWCAGHEDGTAHPFAGHMTCHTCGAVNWKACYHAVADEVSGGSE